MKANISPFLFKKSAIAISLAVLLLLALLAFAHNIVYAEESLASARKLSESGEILPLEDIIAAAKTVKPGQFLEIELERENNHYLYEVEILDQDGQVWELQFNAKTGELIEIERDD